MFQAQNRDLKSCCVLQDYDDEHDNTVFHNTTPDLQDQDRFFLVSDRSCPKSRQTQITSLALPLGNHIMECCHQHVPFGTITAKGKAVFWDFNLAEIFPGAHVTGITIFGRNVKGGKQTGGQNYQASSTWQTGNAGVKCSIYRKVLTNTLNRRNDYSKAVMLNEAKTLRPRSKWGRSQGQNHETKAKSSRPRPRSRLAV